MRNALTHFEEWSRGKGFGPQRDRVKAGEELRDVAPEFWGFGSDPDADAVSMGLYTIDVGTAGRSAKEAVLGYLDGSTRGGQEEQGRAAREDNPGAHRQRNIVRIVRGRTRGLSGHRPAKSGCPSGPRG